MNYKKAVGVALASFLLLAMGACSKTEQKGNGEQKPAASEQNKKDSIVVASSEPETGYDPTTGWGHSSMSMIHGTLFTRDGDLKVVGDIAKDYKISDDRLTWTVTLKDNIKFSNGSPVTASDVAYSYNTAKDSKDSTMDLTMIESVQPVDEKNIAFKIKTPQSTFVDKMSEVGIVPEAIHKADPNGYAQKPVGCGPYVLEQWDKGQQAICSVNEYYHGTKPYFKKLTLLFLGEDAIMSAVKSGQVDVAKVDYTYANTKVNGMEMKEFPSVENIGICFPVTEPKEYNNGTKTVKTGHPVTKDVAIRKALNIAFSRKDMIEGLLNGYGTPAYTGYEQMPWNNNSTIPDGDLEGAKKLLADAGWKDTDGDGIIEKDGVKAEFDLVYTYSTGARQAFAVYIGDNAAKLGMKITPVYKTWDELGDDLYHSVVVLSWGEHSAQLMYNLIYSKMACIDFNNTGCYQNPVVDKHIEDALNAETDAESNEHWKKAIWDGKTGFGFEGDAAWAWYMNTNHIYFVRDGLDMGDVQPQPHGGNILKNVAEWKMK